MLAERYLRRRFQEGREEGREKGRAEGREEARKQLAQRMSELSDEERLKEIDRLIAERRGITGKRSSTD